MIFDQNASITETDPAWTSFLDSVSRFKSFDGAIHIAQEAHCIAAKLDSVSTLHRGIVQHRLTGSWLLAAGTAIDDVDVDLNGDLGRLLEGYLDRGIEALRHLDGQFVLAIYDGRDGRVHVVSDPFAILAVFVGQIGSRVFISTSALAVAQAIGATPSELGTRYFLVTGNVPGDVTLWAGVSKLAPATVLELSARNATSLTYWSLDLDETIDRLSFDESVDCVIQVLSSAFQRGLFREGETWLSLTGGFDSRALALLASRAQVPFKSYCHGPPGSDDTRIAYQICKAMDWSYQHFSLPDDWGHERPDWFSQTVGRSEAHIGVFKTSRIVREQALKAEQFNVSIWGFGGEIYRGFYWKQESPVGRKSTRVNYDRLVDLRIFPNIARPVLKNTETWVHTIRAEIISQVQRIGEQQSSWPKTAKLDAIGTVLEGSIHAGAHVSAAMGLQRAMTPFYSKAGIQTVMSVNPNWRKRNRLFRRMIERMNRAAAKIETADGGPAGPMHLTNLPKFAPLFLHEGKKLTWALGNRFLGIHLWDKGSSAGSEYPIARWRSETMKELVKTGVLEPEKMVSAELYDREVLAQFLLDAANDDFRHEALLSRVATVELAFRELSASL